MTSFSGCSSPIRTLAKWGWQFSAYFWREHFLNSPFRSLLSIDLTHHLGGNLGPRWASPRIWRVVSMMALVGASVLCASWKKRKYCIIGYDHCETWQHVIWTNVWITYHVVLRAGKQWVWRESDTTDSVKLPENWEFSFPFFRCSSLGREQKINRFHLKQISSGPCLYTNK